MIELGAVTEAGPLAEIEAVVSRLEEFDDLVLTSTNAVRFFILCVQSAGRLEELARLRARVLCMGVSTAKAALQAGLPVHLALRGGQGDAEALLDEILAAGPVRGRRVLIPRSDMGRNVLATGLGEAGAEVEAPVFYRNIQPRVDASALRQEIQAGELPILTFSSPSAANHFLALLDDATRSACERCIIVAIGETTGRALREGGLPPDVVPEQPGTLEMVAALVRHKGRSGSGDVGSRPPEEES